MNYTYRKSLQEDPDRYKADKEQIADLVVGLLGRRFLRPAAQVEIRGMYADYFPSLYGQLARHL